MANVNNIQALTAALAKYPQLDPEAVKAIASMEGLSGGIGDNGTSFGPFQLHLGGAYPSFAPHGSPQQDNAWAWSPQGLAYALSQISQVAGGMKGIQAISNISRRFERPANPATEISGAARAYGTPIVGRNIPSYGGPGYSPGRSPGGSSGSSNYSGISDPSQLIMALVQHVLASNNFQQNSLVPQTNPLQVRYGLQ